MANRAGTPAWQWVSPGDVQYFSQSDCPVCWHCCHTFTGHAHPLPTAYDAKKRQYTLEGCFCGWGCVKAHNLEVNGAKYIHREVCMHIARLMSQTSAPECDAAPARTALRMFGGPLDIDRFRSTSRSESCAVAVDKSAHRPQPARATTSLATQPTHPTQSGARAGGKRARADGMRLEQLGFIKRA